MYQYSANEIGFLHQRADQFQQQVKRYRQGTLDPEKFTQLRLRNGLYEELRFTGTIAAFGGTPYNHLSILGCGVDQFLDDASPSANSPAIAVESPYPFQH